MIRTLAVTTVIAVAALAGALLTVPAAAAPEPDVVARAAAASKAGVAVYPVRGGSTALRRSGASWYYTWATGHDGTRTPRGAAFVPVVWGPGSVTREGLREVRRSGSRALLTFNEPDLAEQSDMTVDEALDLWPRLERTGKRLSSPAVAYGGADPGGWLDRFMRGARQRDLRVDFVAVHWYGSDFHPRRATEQLVSYLRDVHRRYGKPVWLTEHALIAFGQQPAFPRPAVQARFLRRSSAAMARLPWLQRHAWFALPAPASGPSTGLFRPGARITPVGEAFRATTR